MKIFNDMDMQLEEFQPIEPGKVKMYACGPTVYNYIHVGNARPIVIFDVLRRYLEYRGYEVTFVQNFTDVDDKIIKRANEEGVTSASVRRRYIPRRPRTSGRSSKSSRLWSKRAMPMRSTAMCTTARSSLPDTASSPTSRSRICSPAHAST